MSSYEVSWKSWLGVMLPGFSALDLEHARELGGTGDAVGGTNGRAPPHVRASAP